MLQRKSITPFIMKKYFYFFLLIISYTSLGQTLKGYYPERPFDVQFPTNRTAFSTCVLSSNCVLFGFINNLILTNGNEQQLINTPDLGMIWSIVEAPDGKIYVGGTNAFGYLLPHTDGTLHYTSLTKYLPKGTNISLITGIYPIHNSLYLVGRDGIIKWQNSKCKVWKSVLIRKSLYHAGKLYLCTSAGLYHFQEGKLSFIANGIYNAICPYDNQSFLLFSLDKGMFIWKNGQIKPFSSELDNFLKGNIIYNAKRLSNGDYAIITSLSGTCIMSAQGKWIEHYSEETGYSIAGYSTAVAEDKEQGVWICAEGGITYIDRGTGIEFFDYRNGVKGKPQSLLLAGKQPYLHLNHQIFKHVPTTPYSTFRPFFTPDSYISSCRSTDQKIVFTSVKKPGLGYYSVTESTQKPISIHPDPHYLVLCLDENNILSTPSKPDKLFAYTKIEGKWQQKRISVPFQDAIGTLSMLYKNTLLLGSATGKSFIMQIPVIAGGYDFDHITYIPVHTNADTPSLFGSFSWTPWQNDALFSNGRKLFSLDDKKGIFSVDTLISKQFSEIKKCNIHLLSPLGLLAASDTLVLAIQHPETPNQEGYYRIWKAANGQYTLQKIQGHPASIRKASIGYYDNAIWADTRKGFAKIPMRPVRTDHFQFPVAITQIQTTNDSLVYSTVLPQNPSKIHFESDQTRIRFVFTAISHVYIEHTYYRYKLDNEQWSAWTQERMKEYTNLPFGSHTFCVQAQNSLGYQSTITSYSFRIATPWYLTFWAYAFYGLAGIGLLYSLYYIRNRQLLQENKKLEALVTERTHTLSEKTQEVEIQNQQIIQQNLKLQEADKLKSNLFTNISHEFRTPLTLILSPLEKQISLTQNNVQRQDLQLIYRNATRLKNLINQLLDLSRIDAEKMSVFYQKGDLHTFLQGIFHLFQSMALQKNISFTYQVPTLNQMVYFDAEKLETILTNLLSNAFKYTPSEGSVQIECTIDGQDTAQPWAHLAITDTGIGMSDEVLNHLFDRFYKAAHTSAQHYDSSGIGLSLTKELVDLLQGTIHVSSIAGKGSQFRLSLPLFRAVPEKNHTLIPTEWTPLSGPLTDWQEQQWLTTTELADEHTLKDNMPVLLIVEDHDDMRKYLGDNLQNEYIIQYAAHGKDGLAQATEHLPDLIISDMMMPEMDGLVFCNQLRQLETTCHIPFILLTARQEIEDRIAGYEYGADLYMSKPFYLAELKAAIQNLLLQRTRLREVFAKQLYTLPIAANQSIQPSKDAIFLEKVQQLIETHLTEEGLNSDFLASQLHIGPHTLTRKLKALINQTPNTCIRQYRLQKAHYLLSQKTYSIKEVAYTVGIYNMSYFAKCFKDTFGVLPSELSAK